MTVRSMTTATPRPRPSCGHDTSTFGTVWGFQPRDPLGLAVFACGLFGTCLDHGAVVTVDVTFETNDRGMTGTAHLA